MLKKFIFLLLLMITFGAFVMGVHIFDQRSRSIDRGLDRKIGQLIMVGLDGTGPESPGFGEAINNLEQGIVGGVVMLPKNISGKTELQTMVRKIAQCACPATPLIAIDEEGGTVDWLGSQYGFPPTASAAEVGRGNAETARAQYKSLAKKLADTGFNMNFGPVVDLNRNANNPIIALRQRSYSSDPAIVESMARIFIEEHHALGILTSLKHFPGHGSSTADSHTEVPDVEGTWSPDELVPYRNLINSGAADTVMVGHLVNQPKWGGVATQEGSDAINRILRGELGFKGVVISDDLTMEAVVHNKGSVAKAAISAVKAGVDLVLVVHPAPGDNGNTGRYLHSALLHAVESGELEPDMIEKAWERVMALKAKLRAVTHENPTY
jgi:beta-N-acetylhexosaminidase